MLWVERGIRPDDFLSADPELQDEVLGYLQDQAAEARREQMRANLKSRLSGGRRRG